jgi:hypothetical protein
MRGAAAGKDGIDTNTQMASIQWRRGPGDDVGRRLATGELELQWRRGHHAGVAKTERG